MSFELLSIESLIALSSLFAAGASFWVSWLSYKRDSGQIDFYVGVGEILNDRTFKKEQEVIQFRIVNAGRRPLLVSQIGGDPVHQRLNRILTKFNSTKFKSRAFVLQSPIVNEHLLPRGTPRLLNEGEFLSFYLSLPDANGLAKQLADSDSIYVFDTVGRKHRVSSGVLKKLREDVKNLIL